MSWEGMDHSQSPVCRCDNSLLVCSFKGLGISTCAEGYSSCLGARLVSLACLGLSVHTSSRRGGVVGNRGHSPQVALRQWNPCFPR